MAPERLSRPQRRILTWLMAEEQRTWGTMAASHQDLVQALVARQGHASEAGRLRGVRGGTRAPGGGVIRGASRSW